MSGFRKAQKQQQKLKMSIQGASGSGKTRSALEIAKHLCPPGKRIALIDTEKSAALYSSEVDFDIDDDFGPTGKESYHQDKWIEKMTAAAASGEYGVLILDSATHLWKGPGGFTSQIDQTVAAQRAKGGKGDSFAAWKEIDPKYNKFMLFLRQFPMHVIMCVRAKTDYEDVVENGKKMKKKVGLAPEFRENFEYELDIQTAIDADHVLVPLKHRLGDVLDGKVFPKPGEDFAKLCLEWLNSGAAEAPLQVRPEPAKAPEPAAESTFSKLTAKVDACASKAELEALTPELSQARRDGLLTDAEYKALSASYSKRLKELKEVVAA